MNTKILEGEPIDDKHPHVLLEYEGKSVEIDEEIAGLITKIWRLGIRTRFCCQQQDAYGHSRGKRGFISFESHEHFEKFMGIMFDHASRDPQGLFARRLEMFGGGDQRWDARLHGLRGRCFAYGLYFPREHQVEIEAALDDASSSL